MTGARPVDLVVAGNLLVDDVVFRDGRTRMGQAGGASLYAALGAALWGARVGVVSVAGSDYPRATLDALEARGVDTSGVRHLDGPGLRTWLLYEASGRRVVHHLGCPAHEDVSPLPKQIVERHPGARAVHIAPMPLAVQRALAAAAARAGAFVSLDPHEPVREDNLAAWRDVVADLDVFFASDEELRLEGAGDDPRAALERLVTGAARVPRWLTYKRGPRGGLLLETAAGAAQEWPACPGRVVDPTGAGDAFAGGFLAGLLSDAGAERALRQGVVAAGFALETWGASGLLGATAEAARARMVEWFGGP